MGSEGPLRVKFSPPGGRNHWNCSIPRLIGWFWGLSCSAVRTPVAPRDLGSKKTAVCLGSLLKSAATPAKHQPQPEGSHHHLLAFFSSTASQR